MSAAEAAAPELSACAVSDALDRLGIAGVLTGLTPMGHDGVVVGRAFPVRFVEGDGPFNQYLDRVPRGSVAVLDVGGRVDVSVWGGLIALEAQRLGLAGTIVHGGCRDVAGFVDSGYPVFARAATPRSGRGVVTSSEVGIPVTIAGIAVAPGDTVVADRDGVVVVPAERAEEALTLARQIARRDAELDRAVAGGLPLAEARRRFS
jgi:4-hydroxy-4-methyl-2-oxoglutarate aldolase